MSNKESDILQIKKYLNGELDAKAMHQLERQALDDPFLMEAMEGYEQAGAGHDGQLASLSAGLLQRTSSKNKKTLSLSFIAIAASVLVVFTVGGVLLFNKKQPENKMLVARVEKVQPPEKAASKDAVTFEKKPDAPYVNTTPTTAAKKTASKKIAHNQTIKFVPPVVVGDAMAEAIPAAPPEDTTSPEEMVVLGMQSADKKVKEVRINHKGDTIPNTRLETKVPGVTKTEAEGHNQYSALNRNVLQGRVFARDNGQPLIGASVRVEGTNKAAVTDVDGKFTIPFDSNKQSRLMVASIGYETREVTAKSRDSLKSIALEPNSTSLNEVVAVGYAARKNTGDDTIPASHPKGGWVNFQKYLRKNEVSPDGKAGVVKLSFQVNHDGSITGIRVTKNLSPASDQKAIDLINNGPEWIGNKNGLPETVQLRIKFVK